MSIRVLVSSVFVVAVCAGLAAERTGGSQTPAAAWHARKSPIETRWASDVSAASAHPEYPRPQMVRKEWLNLNGLWEYAVAPSSAPDAPNTWDGQILVPFPIESALSGVMKEVNETERLWYRRTFTIPARWRGGRVLLHFGAVDWRADVRVNGHDEGTHQGGYDPFTFDITDALRATGPQTVVVSVEDPTDAGTQPRGKQVRRPHSIWYTSTTGIWQTVWLEPVSTVSIDSIRLVPDVDHHTLTVSATTSGVAAEIHAEAFDGTLRVAQASGPAARQLALTIPHPKLWSPDSPFLYDLTVSVSGGGKITDTITSYFGMRKMAIGKDARGVTRLLLNGQPLFEFGPLDQGFWPEGIYAAPTDAALKSDIEQIKALGFNLARKHVKVEPDRWYYWCDTLGLLVWQDMPSGDRSIGPHDQDLTRSEASASEYRAELTHVIGARANHPSIVMWVPFNEGWGQFDTTEIVNLIRTLDPARLVDAASGWTDRGVGDVHDIHVYPGPSAPAPEERRAAVLGEFGGLGLPLAGHTWQEQKNWGYRTFATRDQLTDAYLALIDRLAPLVTKSLSAAVYTQTSDVEIEVNGLMTYDRAIVKMDRAKVAAANRRLYGLSPTR
ncbi:MAG TPA: glycoside hydrolase family 2 TIM barrel-domain containing protein [Vicinamibacterales bacterium]|nr:glycoside hydrolase family 2 TIM barrel-domain containing protein [Vicinamibacterales bacterium]